MWCCSHGMLSPAASARCAAYTSEHLQCANGTVEILLGHPILFVKASGVGYNHSVLGMVSRISWDGQRAKPPHNQRRARSGID